MPIYSGDVSGVPSALYEFGGMVVMHDASGCNSTYNTHDELRWYEKESLIYISGMTEFDAVLGNDKKLINDITEAALELKPKFIAIAGTPIPFMNGTDFNGICAIIEKKTNIPTFFIKTNGLHTYIKGAGKAFEVIADKFVKETKEKFSKKYCVNVLGVTPLDFALSGFENSLKKLLTEADFHVISCWSMESSFDEIMESAKADVNLVVSTCGYKAAKIMEEKFDIPYVVGTPIGKFTDKIIKDLRNAADTKKSIISYENRNISEESYIMILGETVVSESIAAAISEKYNVNPKVLCTVETEDNLLLKSDVYAFEEEDFEEAVKNAKIVIGDPLLKYICPKNCEFYELPHVACSGRMYADKVPDLTDILK